MSKRICNARGCCSDVHALKTNQAIVTAAMQNLTTSSTPHSRIWIKGSTISRGFEIHLCWDSYVLPKDGAQSSPPIDRNGTRCRVVNSMVLATNDSVGAGVALLPRKWQLQHNLLANRLLISLWIISFWFDFSRSPFFRSLPR